MQNTLRVLSMVLVVAMLVVCGANSDDSFEHKATEAEQEMLVTVHVWKRSTMRSLLSTKRWRRTTNGGSPTTEKNLAEQADEKV